MFRTLIVGLGRSGAGLHLPVLARARATEGYRHLFAEQPVVVFDPYRTGGELPGTVLARSLAQASDMADPGHTIVHICTPPTARVGLLEQLARLGYRNILVEKPLALDEQELVKIDRVRQCRNLELVVVAPWLASALTCRIQEIIHAGQLGRLLSISVLQRKPRFTRSLGGPGHPTAFDIEMPHAVGVALRVAGSARLGDAVCTDMRLGDVVLPRMGGAWMYLEHISGARTEIVSDMTSPTRERRISLEMERGTLVGHYSSSEEDDTAQLIIRVGGLEARAIFRDDALATFMLHTYEHFAGSGPGGKDLSLNADVVRLLADAKRACERRVPAHMPWAAFVAPRDDPGQTGRTAGRSNTRGSGVRPPVSV